MKVIGNPNGEYRGKLAGIVFSRNKSGAIARSYVKPTQKNSTGQVKARNRLGASSQAFKNLLATQAKNWEFFAKNLFNPKVGLNSGQFSGANAYTALKTSATNGAEIGQEASFEQNSLPIDAGATFADFVPVNDAPITSVGAEVNTSPAGCTGIVTISNASLDANYKPTIGITLIPVNIGSDIFQYMKDTAGNDIGLMITMSTPNNAAGRVFRQNDIQTLAIVKAPAGLTGTLSGGEIEIVPDVNPLIADFAVLPSPGQYVNIGLWLIGTDGRSKKIGYQETLVV